MSFGEELDFWRELMVRVDSSFKKFRKNAKDRSSFD
jgi:hypothetical protein